MFEPNPEGRALAVRACIRLPRELEVLAAGALPRKAILTFSTNCMPPYANSTNPAIEVTII